jgi:hypothetical protein
MTTLTLFHKLHASGVTLTPCPDGMLRYKAPKGTVTPALLDAMREHKADLIDLVEAFKKRVEMLGGCPRIKSSSSFRNVL